MQTRAFDPDYCQDTSEEYTAIARCELCEDYIMFDFKQEAVIYDPSEELDTVRFPIDIKSSEEIRIDCKNDVTLVQFYPENVLQCHSSWPRQIPELLDSVRNNLGNGTIPSVPIMTCRTILDIATKELKAKGRDLLSKIDDLRADGKITQPIADWAHWLRLSGNAAAHAAQGTTTEAKALFDFVVMFMNVCFTLPAEIEQHNASKTSIGSVA